MATSACWCARWLISWRTAPDGLRQTAEDAVLGANYIRNRLEPYYDLPYKTPCMHEVVFSDRRQAAQGVKTGDIAKRLIDYGFHPYTVSFPLIVPGALMIEPTESESKEEIDLFIEAMSNIAQECEQTPELVTTAAPSHPHFAAGRSQRRPQTGTALAPVEGEKELPNAWGCAGARLQSCQRREAASNVIAGGEGRCCSRLVTPGTPVNIERTPVGLRRIARAPCPAAHFFSPWPYRWL